MNRIHIGLGAFVVAALTLAAYWFVTGESLAALKLVLLMVLAPGIALLAVFAVRQVLRPGWYRVPEAVVTLMFCVGGVLLITPLLAYMPWAPSRFPLDEMPFGLYHLVVAGGVLVGAGASFGLAVQLHDAWKKRDVGGLAAGLVLLAVIGYVVTRFMGDRVME